MYLIRDQSFEILEPTNASCPYIVVSFVFDTDESILAKQTNARPIQYYLNELTNTAQLIVPEYEEMCGEEFDEDMEIASVGLAWWEEADDFLDTPSPWSDVSFYSSASSDTTLVSPDTPTLLVADTGSVQKPKFESISGLLDMHTTALSDASSYSYTGAIDPWRSTLVHAINPNTEEGEREMEDWTDDYEWAEDSDLEAHGDSTREEGMGLSVIEEEDEEDEDMGNNHSY